MRQLVGAGIEFTIGEALVLEHHRDRIGGAGDLSLEQLRHGGGGNRMGGVVPRAQDGVTLCRSENVEPADRLIGIATAASSRRTRRPAKASTLARSNRSGR